MDKDIKEFREKLVANRDRVGGYRAFAKEADLCESWVYKFAEGRIITPRARNLGKAQKTLQRLLSPEPVVKSALLVASV